MWKGGGGGGSAMVLQQSGRDNGERQCGRRSDAAGDLLKWSHFGTTSLSVHLLVQALEKRGGLAVHITWLS